MTAALRWPDAGEYAMAARDCDTFFLDDAMRRADLRKSPLGIPLPATGRNAVVFQIDIAAGTYAARCFTNPPAEGRLRYDALGAYVERHPIPAIAAARWLDDAVKVNGTTLPMIQMEWVDGRNLDDYIQVHVDDNQRMRALTAGWTDLMQLLELADIAHGDLQHGNVLVEADGSIRLVDLDGVWTPSSSELVPSEVGHRNYQHPQRITEGYWSRSVDAFSALAIAVTLEALCQHPQLWGQYYDGANNLLLTEADFVDPGTTPVWTAMSALETPVPELLDRLAHAADADVSRLSPPTTLMRLGQPVTRRAPPQFLLDALQAAEVDGFETHPDLDSLPPPTGPAADAPGSESAEGAPTGLSPVVIVGLALVAIVLILVGIAAVADARVS